jgi:hypothetical protein
MFRVLPHHIDAVYCRELCYVINILSIKNIFFHYARVLGARGPLCQFTNNVMLANL